MTDEYEEFPADNPVGRPRIHADRAGKQWAYRQRLKEEASDRRRIEGACRRLFIAAYGREPASWRELAEYLDRFAEELASGDALIHRPPVSRDWQPL